MTPGRRAGALERGAIPAVVVGKVALDEYVDPLTGDPEAGGLSEAVLLIDDVADDHVVLSREAISDPARPHRQR
ncbi:MAG: hypothetical protein IPI32_06305 [Austwickia sp.]|nr:hypothetical protein [Austwickia sp.]MBK9102554.1 hypothetical protein [Austwickia sp.]